MTPEISQRVDAFRKDLKVLALDHFVQKHITYGSPYALDSELYFALKSAIGKQFGLHHTQVLLVGSAKLGFSIVAEKRYREFGETSDLDIALVSTALFDTVWDDAYAAWRAKVYWPTFNTFSHYLFRGWIRPDKLPTPDSFPRSKEWWEFFRTLTATQQFGPYRITAGLYRSWRFLETYQTTCVTQCRDAEG